MQMPDPLKQPLSKRARLRDALQDRFEAQVTRLANGIDKAGVRGWHASMQLAVFEHYSQQAALGAGSN
jgi:hypothetical protein